jgi:PhnB protein
VPTERKNSNAGRSCASASAFDDQFWGDRFGVVADPFGHQWQIATHKEDLTPEEIMERGKTAMAGMS